MIQFIEREPSNAIYAYKMIWRKTAADLGNQFYIMTKCKNVKLHGFMSYIVILIDLMRAK